MSPALVTPIQILLSTYNGATFLRPLIDSVVAQDHPSFSILVREDGSSDATLAILAERAASDPRLRYYLGPHIGPPASFFELLTRADSRGYVALCDQDDVWLPDKLSRAAAWLDAQPVDLPLLYCGRQVLVDDALTRLGLSQQPRRGPSFANALVENIAAGCTIVLNDAARRLLADRPPRDGIMHDSWAYLVVAAVGRVEFDETPVILYRQHADNTVGSRLSAWDGWTGRVRRLWRARYRATTLDQAREFDRLFGGEIDAPRAQVLRRFLDHRDSWRESVAYALRPDVRRQSWLDDVVLRVLMGFRHV